MNLKFVDGSCRSFGDFDRTLVDGDCGTYFDFFRVCESEILFFRIALAASPVDVYVRGLRVLPWL